MKKNRKGNYRYLQKQRQIEILKTVLMFGISLSLFMIGYITTKTKANLLTVVAILGCLPACKSAVNMIMFFRAKGCSEPLHQDIERHIGTLTGLYDLYFTSYDKNFSISHLVVTSNQLVAFSENRSIQSQAFETHMKKMLEQDGLKDYTVKLFTEEKKYLQRLEELNTSATAKEPSGRVVSMLESISL